MDIPRKMGDDHEVVLAPYNSDRIHNIVMIFVIFFSMFLIPNVEHNDQVLLYDLY